MVSTSTGTPCNLVLRIAHGASTPTKHANMTVAASTLCGNGRRQAARISTARTMGNG